MEKKRRRPDEPAHLDPYSLARLAQGFLADPGACTDEGMQKALEKARRLYAMAQQLPSAASASRTEPGCPFSEEEVLNVSDMVRRIGIERTTLNTLRDKLKAEEKGRFEQVVVEGRGKLIKYRAAAFLDLLKTSKVTKVRFEKALKKRAEKEPKRRLNF